MNVLIFIMALALINGIYYGFVFACFRDRGFKTKKEFFVSLIPFSIWAVFIWRGFSAAWKGLK